MLPFLKRRRPVRNAYTPLSEGNCLFYYDLADASTLYDATTGGSLVALDGRIARANDLSGNNRHATQGTLNNRLLRRVGGAEGNGTSEYLVTPTMTVTEKLTVYVVFTNGSAAQYRVVVGYGTSHAGAGTGYTAVQSNKLETDRGEINNSSTYLTFISDAAIAGIGVRLVSAQVYDVYPAYTIMYKNGVFVEQSRNEAFNATGTASIAFGLFAYSNGNTAFAGTISAAIAFTGAHDAATVARVSNYLIAKHSVTV